MGYAVERQCVEIPYSPRQQFLPYHYRKERWACVVAHRRAGKTVACVNELIKGALTCTKPNPRFAYIAPLHVQAKDVAWGYVKQYSASIPGHEINESELRVDFPNGGRVRLYGADNYDRLRGIYLDGVILDEFADMDPRVWPEVIRPALSDRQGWSTFIGTPKGRNAFFDIFETSKVREDWFSLRLKADETGIVAQAELDDARSMMTPEQFAQEYLVSFDAAILGAYYGKEIADAEREGRICQVEYDPTIPVHTSWDLGIGDSTAIWFWQIAPNGVRVIDFYENHGQALGHYAAELQARGYNYGHDFVPHDARARELGTGRSRLETLLGLKRKPRVLPSQRVEEGINAARVTFPKLWFDADKCKFGLEALRQYRAEFDDKAKVFKNTPKHDWTSHAADAFRYLCMGWRELKPEPAPKPKTNQVFMADEATGVLQSNFTFQEMIRRKERAAKRGR
jgi:phage terminase large subunit